MTEKSKKPVPNQRVHLSSSKLNYFFLTHLDRIYSAKMHLLSKLPGIAEQAQFSDLKQAIVDTITDVQKQVARMQIIYTLLDAEVSAGSIHGFIGLVNDAYEAIEEQSGEPELQDLSIIFYLQNIESIEMASFQILQIAAVKFNNKQISSLLNENYNGAKSVRSLLLLISSKYISS